MLIRLMDRVMDQVPDGIDDGVNTLFESPVVESDSAVHKMSSFLTHNNVAVEIFLGIIICLIIYGILYLIRLFNNKVTSKSEDSPVILSGIVSAKYARELKQNPNVENSKTLLRSMNENGIEYTYSLWMYINSDNYTNPNVTGWKHVFHKGPKITYFDNTNSPDSISPIQSPGLWLKANNNALRLYVNSYDNNDEFLEISNLPVKKWIHLVYTQSNFTSNVYINGRLKTSHNLRTLPRQNYYNLYMTENGGFDGYLSSMRYFNYVLAPSAIYDLSRKGPILSENKEKLAYQSDSEESHMKSVLPYLSNRWWVDDLTMS